MPTQKDELEHAHRRATAHTAALSSAMSAQTEHASRMISPYADASIRSEGSIRADSCVSSLSQSECSLRSGTPEPSVLERLATLEARLADLAKLVGVKS